MHLVQKRSIVLKAGLCHIERTDGIRLYFAQDKMVIYDFRPSVCSVHRPFGKSTPAVPRNFTLNYLLTFMYNLKVVD